jgi:hypothetical protein
MKCGPDGNFTNLFLADGKYQNLSDPLDLHSEKVSQMTGLIGTDSGPSFFLPFILSPADTYYHLDR